MATASLSTASAAEAHAPRPMARAVPVVLASIGIGLIAQLLFFDVALGANLPIATAVLLAAGWAVRDRSQTPPRVVDRWLPAAALVLSAFVALRGDTTLVVLDLFGVLGLTGAALASFASLRVVERPFGGLLLVGGGLLVALFGGGGAPIGAARHALPAGRLRDRIGWAAPVLRGLLIAIPLILLFAALFASADAVFAEIAGGLFDWKLDLGSIPGRLAMALVAAWLAAGLLAFVVRAAEPAAAERRLEAAWAQRPRLGTAEALTVLLALDLLFVGFVVLQGAYLFGGRDTLEATGLSYAEYARRGFFELLAVAFMVGGLVLALEAFVARRTRAYRVGAIGLVLLTLVVLASAFLRLRLYQDAYGWTELRFYVAAAIAWLAIGAVTAVVAIVADRSRLLLHGLLALSVVFGLTFNLIGPVRFIAEQNVARAIEPGLVAPGGSGELDVWYLASLGDDAVAVLVDALARLPAADRPLVEEVLHNRAAELERDEGGRAWQAWNLSRERARSLLSR